MMIPLVDLQAQYSSIKNDIDAAIGRVLNASSFILGEEVRSFEEQWARYCGTRYAVGTSSGTSALFLALKACGVGEGDEVITTPLTFTATAEAICYTGARPVFVDIDPVTFNMDVRLIEQSITERTKALVPVHLYGNPCDMDAILNIAGKHHLMVIEDAAQAHGATYKDRTAGAMGDIGCFSFYPGKNLGAYGDAGAIVTNHERLADKVRLLRNHGRTTKYEHLEIGYGARLDALQAAVLKVKLDHLQTWTALRQRWARAYADELKGLPLSLVEATPGAVPVYHIFAIGTDRQQELIQTLHSFEIKAGIHYPIPLHLQPAYQYLGYLKGEYPNAEQAAETEVSLPMYPELGMDNVNTVVSRIRSFFGY